MSEEMYKSMFQDAIGALAAIDTALGMPEDGCNSPERTITAIKLLHATHTDDVAEIDRLRGLLREAVTGEVADVADWNRRVRAALAGAAVQPSAVPDFKTWREHELRYVCEAMRDISRQNGEAARESANDVLAWAENRLRAADNAAAAPQPSAALRAYYETHEPPHCPTCGCGTADNGTAEPT